MCVFCAGPAPVRVQRPPHRRGEKAGSGLQDAGSPGDSGETLEKKEEPFLLAYGDGEQLYIAMGYGEQESGGYSIQIEEVCETEDAVCIRTCLTGPDEGEKVSQEPDCPYATVATEYTEKRILWER